ncbi:inter-alpha-trypsin inhibitor heavy chain H6 [Electrophorus electricus]|uniref:inter-alpha-trypsin inhibitor heavy chain H6 n=1 Tax=Electrophorus electricus TaxID=8005 RepID=UPI0015D00F03|nr:inter-alpha-trypsin inhibitor heavy chain H6 [Electrophorus electricus]
MDAQSVSLKKLRHQSKMVKPSLKITDYHVHCTVMSRYALTTVESTVWNQFHLTKEAAFEVDLPASAFISNFTITSGGKVYVAQVKERAAARKFYDAAKKHGKIAGLVATKERETEKFRVVVSMPPAIHMSFSISYEELLTRRLGRYELALGLRPGQPVQNLSVDITIAEQSGISFMKVLPLRTSRLLSSTVQAEAEVPPSTQVQQNPYCAHIHYSPTLEQQRNLSPKGLNADFVIQYDVELKDLMGDIQVLDGYFVHYFAPRALPVVSKDVIFVIDISGSMIGNKIKQTKAAMSTILDELREGDYFNLITFSDKVHTWKKGRTVQATKQNIQEAKEFVRKISAEGWTNINAALLSAAHLVNPSSSSSASHSLSPRRVPMIIFLTDGEATIGVTAQDAILHNAQSALGSVSLFGLAFGDDADFPLLKRLALENRGIARMVFEDADAALQLKGFYDEVASPLLSDIQLSYLEDQAYDVTRVLFPNYFQGSELVVTGKIKSGVQEMQVSLTANDSKQKLKVESKARLAKSKGNETATFLDCKGSLGGIYSFVQRLWAYFTIKELLLAKINSTDSLAQQLLAEKATNLSLKYNFVTPVTSLVVVKPDTDKYPTSISSIPTSPVTTTTESVMSTVTQTFSANPKTVSIAAAGTKKSKSILALKIAKRPLTKSPQQHVPSPGLHTTGHPANTVSPGKHLPPSSLKSTTTLLPSTNKTISAKISSKASTTMSTMLSLHNSSSTATPPTKVFTTLPSIAGSTTSLPTKSMTTPSSVRPLVLPVGKFTSPDSENSTAEVPSLQELGLPAVSLYKPQPADPNLDMNVDLDIPILVAATFAPMPGITDAPKPWEASGILDVSTTIQFETKGKSVNLLAEYDVPYDYDYTILYDLYSDTETADNPSTSSVFSSSVDGDPHFFVKLPNLQQNLCFTVDGRANDVLRLLEDPEKGIIVEGHLILAPTKRGVEEHTRTFFDKITIKIAKGGISVTLMIDSVVVKGEGLHSLPTTQQGSVTYLDLKIVLDGHQSCWIDFGKGMLFLVVFHRYSHPSYYQMEHLGFYIADGEGLSSLTQGLLGQFQHSHMEVVRIMDSHGAGFHHAQTSKNTSLAMGLLMKGNQHIPVTLQDKNLKITPSKRLLAQCWVVPKVEVERLLGHSYESYLVDHL